MPIIMKTLTRYKREENDANNTGKRFRYKKKKENNGADNRGKRKTVPIV